MKKQIFLTTDGACIGNPGPGGWACILRYEEHFRELSGGEPETTNNRMELRAVIEGLRTLKESCSINVRTDSQYLRDGITKWIQNWKASGWQNKVKGQGLVGGDRFTRTATRNHMDMGEGTLDGCR